MTIKNHLLYDDSGKQIPLVLTPNKAGKYVPKYLVMHYTAATTANSSINWFKNPAAKASAHLLIDREGHITQFAPFNVVTWHAGTSRWNGIIGLNSHSIGIELVNGGKLSKVGENFICNVDKRPVPAGEVIFAKHKNETEPIYWQQYSERQIAVSMEIAALLVSQYGLKDVLGHEDISPMRKADPGPAFPMASVRARAMGRVDEDIDLYVTTAAVNIRSGAGTMFATITSEPLPAKVKVQVLKRDGNWSFVEVMDVVHNINDLEGWINSKFLKQI